MHTPHYLPITDQMGSLSQEDTMFIDLVAPYSQNPVVFATPFDEALARQFRPWLEYAGSLLQQRPWMGPFVAPLNLSESAAWELLLAGMALQLNTLGPLQTKCVGQFVANALGDTQSALHFVAMRFTLLHAYRHHTGVDDLARRLSQVPDLQVPAFLAHVRRTQVTNPAYQADYGQWLVEEVEGLIELIAGNPDDRGYPDPAEGLSACTPQLQDLQGGYPHAKV